jgi:NhaP-type Na+/H+ or K+/H+ antiporter
VFWWEIAIGIVLGLLLGIAIVLAFVFLLSGNTIDAPSISAP